MSENDGGLVGVSNNLSHYHGAFGQSGVSSFLRFRFAAAPTCRKFPRRIFVFDLGNLFVRARFHAHAKSNAVGKSGFLCCFGFTSFLVLQTRFFQTVKHSALV